MRTSNLRWTSAARPFALAEALAEGAPASQGIVIDPPLAPRDEAIFLLHVAAEVEHALLVQYLYAAFSLRLSEDFGPGAPADAAALTNAWYADILQTAQEEMGHLLTVQNALRYIGGPLTFEREDFPFRADVYPFHFRLQPLQRNSLAKYVAAERPDPTFGLTAQEQADLDALLATLRNDQPVNRVGRVYDRLIQLTGELTPADLRPDRAADYQQVWSDWSFDDPANFITRNVHDTVVAVDRGVIVYQIKSSKDLLDALTAVAIQGEGGSGASVDNHDSHFWRFFKIYRAFPNDSGAPTAWEPDLPVAVNPNTTVAPQDLALLYPEEQEAEKELVKGRITQPQTRLWAQLFNLRYRILLTCLSHTLSNKVSDVHHTVLIGWAFEEMSNVGKLARILAGLDRSDSSADGKAGATFELPYTLTLPDDDTDRWRNQRDLLIAAAHFYRDIKPAADQATLIDALRAGDGADNTTGRRAVIEVLLNPIAGPATPGQPIADGVRKTSFAMDILPLFRAIDIQHMNARGVRLADPGYMTDTTNAQAVLEVLTNKSMPIGGPFWSQPQLDLFKKWLDEGLLP